VSNPPTTAALVARLSARLRAIRERRGLTQDALGKVSGLSQMAVSHFETGRRLPCAENLVALCRALDCSADYLLGLKEKP
jgi:transcriptional regulator with XRE-family HTH domain